MAALKNSLLVISIVGVTALLAAIMDSHHAQSYMLWCFALTTLVHLLIAAPSLLLQTERWYDLTGSIAVMTMLIAATIWARPVDVRSGVMLAFAMLWTVRLGGFLFYRVRQVGHDRRFADMKQSPSRFAIAWAMSATWTFVTIMPVLAVTFSAGHAPLSWWGILLCVCWLLCFAGECTADWQKWRFKQSQPTQPFITSGLWAYSRHPNYAAEIGLWSLMALLAIPLLSGAYYLALLSPIFVYWLLTQVSGVNLLEAANDKRFGDISAYQQYKTQTPRLWPWWRRQ